MYNPFKQKTRSQQPFLSPLGERERSLPAIAAPLAVTVIGGLALVIAFGALFSGMARKTGTPAAAAPAIEQQAAMPQVSPPTAPETISDAAAATREEAPVTTQMDATDRTAAIPPPVADPDPGPRALSLNVPVAENEEDIAVLEVIQMQQVEDEPGPDAVAEDEAEPTVVAQAQADPGLKAAVVNGAVNMRAAPDNDARVLAVVPAKAQIEAQDDCNWCAVTYQGDQGFIYKSFIDYR